MGILETLRNAWKIADLRKKILYTLFIIVLFRIGSSIPVPFINAESLANFFNAQGSLLGYLNMLSGNALAEGTIFALTIQPYINASIIIQLLTIAIPALERLQKDGGEEGQKKINQITRYVTVAIALLQGFGYLVTLKSSSNGATPAFTPADGFNGVLQQIGIVFVLVAGSCLVMWLGESINEKGIGNGISMILFASIVSRGPQIILGLVACVMNGLWYIPIVVIVMALLILAFIVFMDGAERRIPIQYAKRQIGRKMYGGQNTHLPIKVVMTGVMPIIFTYAIINIPATIAQFLPGTAYESFIKTYFSQTSPAYIILTFILIIAFNYFYISIQYNPVEIANNIKNNGGTIPGIRPGKPTSDFIIKTVNKVTLFGALFLGLIAILPYLVQIIFPEAAGYGVAIALGGTSILILVSVALETVKQLEAQMLMRHYKGFLE